jgi:hypothetical protein
MLRLEYALVFQLCAGQYGHAGTILFLASKRTQFFAGTSAGGALDSSMFLSSLRGSAGAYGYRLQSDAAGCPGLSFSGYWVAAY